LGYEDNKPPHDSHDPNSLLVEASIRTDLSLN